MPTVAAQPYAYTFEPPTTALVVIDMQRDFIEPGGFAKARAASLRVVHTREGHRPDLGDCPRAKLRRGSPELGIGGARGCLLVEDATEIYFEAFKLATLEMVRAQGGIVGWTAPSAALRAPA